MPPGISTPPLPPPAVLLAAGAVAVVVGALLTVWGRRAGRPVLACLAGAAAAAAAPTIASHLPVKNVYLVGAVAVLTVFLFAFLLTRVFWAVLLGAAIGVAVVAILVAFRFPDLPGRPTWPAEPLTDFRAWSLAAGDHLAGWVRALWQQKASTVALAGGVPVTACIAVEMYLAGSVVIFASSCLGAAAMVCGAGLLGRVLRPAWIEAMAGRWSLAAVAAVVLALLGMLLQFHQAARQRAARDEDDGQADGQDDAEGGS